MLGFPARRRPRQAHKQTYRPVLERLETRRVLSTFTVRNTNDSGNDSLRDVITRVNGDTANPNPDTIAFAIPGGGVQTIALLSDLPSLTHPAVVNGGSQPGFAGTPLIVLDGTGDASGFGTGLTVDASADANAFRGSVLDLGFTNFNTGIAVLPGSAALTVTLTNNAITVTNPGIGIDITGGTGAVTATLSRNHIHADGAGIGIDFFQTGPVKATLTGNTVTADGGGIAIDFFRVNSVQATLKGNHVQANGGGFGIDISNITNGVNATLGGNVAVANNGGFAIDIDHVGTTLTATLTSNQATALGGGTSSTLTLSGNHATTDSGGFGIDIENNSAATSTATTIKGNTVTSSGLGTGLFLKGGSGFQALVQANHFSKNQVGVSVNGDSTAAGTVDLGGGPLGSTGGNDFKSFTTATASSSAIGLFAVGPNYSMDALSNLFTVADPTTVIADGSHDPAAGGSGTIVV
jgi:hypothetical protein